MAWRAPASCIFSPVCGLRPSRAARSLESKVPKPTSETRSPLATDPTMTSRADPSTAAAVYFETPAFSVIAATRGPFDTEPRATPARERQRSAA